MKYFDYNNGYSSMLNYISAAKKFGIKLKMKKMIRFCSKSEVTHLKAIFQSFKNQPIYVHPKLVNKSVGWFLYDGLH